MSERDSYCHGLKFDKFIRITTDNVVGKNLNPQFNPTPPVNLGYFLLLNGTNFLLLNGQNLVRL